MHIAEKIANTLSSIVIAFIMIMCFPESLGKAAIIYIIVEWLFFFIENYCYGFIHSKHVYKFQDLQYRICVGLLVFTIPFILG